MKSAQCYIAYIVHTVISSGTDIRQIIHNLKFWKITEYDNKVGNPTDRKLMQISLIQKNISNKTMFSFSVEIAF